MHVTPCECEGPGWCARHRRAKSPLQFELCRRRSDYFRLWEEGTGPGQGHDHLASTGHIPCRHLGAAIGIRECEGCRGRVRLKLFGCRIHGSCTRLRPVEGLCCCADCEDKESKSIANERER